MKQININQITEHNRTQTNGHNEQLMLAIGVEFHTRNVVFPPTLTYKEWLACGAFIDKCKDAVVFWRADWLQEGRSRWSAKEVAKGVEQLRLDLGQLKQADLLNRLAQRKANQTKEHHFVLAKAKLSEQDERTWWALVEKEKLSARELEESLRAGTVIKLYAEEYERSGGFVSIEGIASNWKMLRRQIGDFYKEWTPQEIQTFLSYLAPIEQFASELRARVASIMDKDGPTVAAGSKESFTPARPADS